MNTSINKPLSQEEAADIAEDFMDLDGTGIFIETEDVTIACNVQQVVMAPYPDEEKTLFINAIKAGEDAAVALARYTGDEYDVLITGFDADGVTKEMIVIPIRTYTAAYGIPYRYP